MLKGNTDKVKDGLDKAGDVVDDKTGGKFGDKIDMATDKVGEIIEDQVDGEDGGSRSLSPAASTIEKNVRRLLVVSSLRRFCWRSLSSSGGLGAPGLSLYRISCEVFC